MRCNVYQLYRSLYYVLFVPVSFLGYGWGSASAQIGIERRLKSSKRHRQMSCSTELRKMGTLSSSPIISPDISKGYGNREPNPGPLNGNQRFYH